MLFQGCRYYQGDYDAVLLCVRIIMLCISKETGWLANKGRGTGSSYIKRRMVGGVWTAPLECSTSRSLLIESNSYQYNAMP